jgi:acetolactate synthase-1/2/3 large subunit
MRVADYIAQALADKGVRHVFLVTGGGAMHLNDALGHEPRIAPIYNHHEQASAIAAEAYARVSGTPGVINVTTGPGGINALNGVFGAWTDSIPMLIISGQVKRETCMAFNAVPGLRQLGDQEADIVGMVKGITKYAVVVREPGDIRYHLEKAWHLAQMGRPGPCWLDIPIDIQGAQVEPESLRPYEAAEDAVEWDRELIARQCRQTLEAIRKAKRPAILAGTGIRLAGALDVFQRVIHKLGIPVTTAWTHDLIASDDPVFCGRQGSIGERAGNFTVQNSDVLLILGARLPIRQVSYNWKSFARHATKIQVDIDLAELHKPTVTPDIPVHCDARLFLEELERQIDASGDERPRHAAWLDWCRQRVERYPAVLPRHRIFTGKINPYHFMEVLSAHLAADDVIVCANATPTIVAYQVLKLRLGQRLLSNSGSASMGWDLPAAIGAAIARGAKRVICLAGDGSIQMNIQELQTIVHHRLPVKILVLNNAGYLSIRGTQTGFFGRMAGADPDSGVSFPDMVKVAGAYGIPACRMAEEDFGPELEALLKSDGPALADVILDPDQGFEPRLSSRQLPDGKIVTAPIEDMFPFLDREEFARNILFEENKK